MADSASKSVPFLPRALGVGLGALLVTGLILLLYLSRAPLTVQLDYKIHDSLLRMHGAREISPVPVIIDIDEASLEAFGQWPWPRYLLAELLVQLSNAGVRAVGLDILLAEPDRTSPLWIKKNLDSQLGLELDFQGLPENFLDNDKLFAEILAQCPAVLGMHSRSAAAARMAGAALDTPEELLPPKTQIGLIKVPPDLTDYLPLEQSLIRGYAPLVPLQEFSKVAPAGVFNMDPDSDGINRRLPLAVSIGDNVYASLALRTLMRAAGHQSMRAVVDQNGLVEFRVQNYRIPVDNQGNLLVAYAGPARSFPYYSAAAVIGGRVGPEELAGRIAFVGTSAAGLLDTVASPTDKLFPGVEVHATVLNSILNNDYMQVPRWEPGIQFLGILLIGLLAAFAFGLASPAVYLPTTVLLLGGLFGGSWLLFGRGLFVTPLYGALTVAGQCLVQLGIRFRLEEKQKKVLRQAFSRYVSPDVVKRIVKLKGDIFEGEEREVSIMFTDIRGFTSISEKLGPRDIVSFLNGYFTPMTEIVKKNGGTLDKFIGDALMAFWNAPLAVPDHPSLAVESGLAMQEALLLMNEGGNGPLQGSVGMGVGINTGSAYVGNMGSAHLLNYTIIGDNVNLASRLEGLCSQYGVGIVVSGECMEQCVAADPERFCFTFLDSIRVKGRATPVRAYTVLRPAAALQRAAELKKHEDAGRAYTEGNFALAASLFAELAQAYPEVKLYTVFRDRAETLLAEPPKSWDGVWTLKSK